MQDKNEYNTTDPSTLLRLKRQEAAAMLSLVRSVTPDSSRDEIIDRVLNTIRQLLGVEKLLLVLRDASGLQIARNYNFDPPALQDLPDLLMVKGITTVQSPEQGFPFHIRAEYIIPLGSDKDRPDSWILIADFAESEAETMNDLIFIETVGSFMQITLERIRLYEEKQEQDRIQNELDVAARIQQESLPSDFDLIHELDIYGRCIAHSKVAGDFYDIILLSDEEIFICIADAAGKGIAAAMLVANLQANLRALIETDAGFYLYIHRLHQVIARLTRNEKFVTLFLAKINIVKREIEYVNAGHNPPFMVRPNGEVHELTKGCIPLGILPIETYEVGFAHFGPGDLLFTYSDGVVEQENARGELLGSDRVKTLLVGGRESDTMDIIAQVLSLLKTHSEGVPNSDDVSMLAVRFKENS
ncbi:MAG: PP2C family protein-serine/threonine phosphatase [Bacteroidetes bacterium]|nr:PP2C family protein-serine/threonine phosphatase [Bacteroidota bacterium]